MAKKWKIKIVENSSGVEFIQYHKGKTSRNFTPSDLDFGTYTWEEIKVFYLTSLHSTFIIKVKEAIRKYEHDKKLA